MTVALRPYARWRRYCNINYKSRQWDRYLGGGRSAELFAWAPECGYQAPLMASSFPGIRTLQGRPS